MLKQIISEKWLTAKGIIGIYPAVSAEDDILVLDGSGKTITTLHTIRQQTKKPAGQPNLALSDFVCPQSFNSHTDFIGAFAVSTGFGVDEKVKEFEKQHDDYNSIMLKALADRLAEAFAERMHERVRKELWGYAPDENLSGDELIAENSKIYATFQKDQIVTVYFKAVIYVREKMLIGLVNVDGQEVEEKVPVVILAKNSWFKRH